MAPFLTATDTERARTAERAALLQRDRALTAEEAASSLRKESDGKTELLSELFRTYASVLNPKADPRSDPWRQLAELIKSPSFSLPVAGDRVYPLGQFGNRTDPFSGEHSFHSGVDFAAPAGTPVRAAADGLVVFSGWDRFGRTVKVEHSERFQTFYRFLSEIDVRVGQKVRQGEILGKVGFSGLVTAPHLHFEMHFLGKPLDPSTYLR